MAELDFILVTLNGKHHRTRAGTTVRALLEQLEMSLEHMAVELNHAIVKRKDWEHTMLQPGDTVEVVRLVGGG